jgi:MraZ protein
VLFTSEYEHTIDSKQRLAIPAEIRARMDPKKDGAAFYVAPGSNGRLWLWPERTFERLSRGMEGSFLPEEDLLEFEEVIFPRAMHVEMDSAGRIRIPERMLAEHGLSQSVVIVGMRDHLEIRDPAEWKATREQQRSRYPEIMRKARQAMLRRENSAGSSTERTDRETSGGDTHGGAGS